MDLPGKSEGGRLCLFCGPARLGGGWKPPCWPPERPASGFLRTAGAWGGPGGGASGPPPPRDIRPEAELTMSRTVSKRSWPSGIWTVASWKISMCAGQKKYDGSAKIQPKGTVARDFLVSVFFLHQIAPTGPIRYVPGQCFFCHCTFKKTPRHPGHREVNQKK